MTNPIGQHISTLPVDMVNAIVRDMDSPLYPCQITVFCDTCGVENSGDYIMHEGMSQGERFGFARLHLVLNQGWECGEKGDFCPTCKAGSA